MKLLTTLTLGLIAFTSLQAQTSMCFKENHKNMMTIESTPLDGGACLSQKSVQDMNKEGWITDDIKIDGNNYIYIFKKDEVAVSNLDIEKIEQQIMARLEQKEKNDAVQAKMEKRSQMSLSGKKLYIKQCQTCHGEKGEKKARNTSRALNSLPLVDITIAIRDYTLDEYDRGNALVMKPYANLLTQQSIKNVYTYLKSINEVERKEEASK